MNTDLIHDYEFTDRTSKLPPHERLPARAAARAMVERDFSALLKQEPRVLELALKEAEALAWQTGVPELVLLTLAEEKAAGVALWHARQAALRPHGQIHAFAE
jgi:hypothetical protein